MVNAGIAGLNVLQARNQGPRLRDRDYKGSCSLGGGEGDLGGLPLHNEGDPQVLAVDHHRIGVAERGDEDRHGLGEQVKRRVLVAQGQARERELDGGDGGDPVVLTKRALKLLVVKLGPRLGGDPVFGGDEGVDAADLCHDGLQRRLRRGGSWPVG